MWCSRALREENSQGIQQWTAYDEAKVYRGLEDDDSHEYKGKAGKVLQ